MRLSASQNAYLLRCRCGPANLAFSGREVVVHGRVTCRACGQAASWQDLLETSEPAEDRGAELHILHS